MSRVGENIDAHCLKCKLVLAHVVLYEVNGAVSKVKCKTCGAEHKYRGVKPPAPKGAAKEKPVKERWTRTQTGKTSVDPAPIRWETQHRNLNPDTAVKPYRIQDLYQVGDVIQHSAFGLGFVEKIATYNRMDVLFQAGVKFLAMNVG